MKIQKFEQSGFIFETDSGFRLAIDIGDKTPIERLEGIKVDAAMASHIHSDHYSLEHIEKMDPKYVYLTQECINNTSKVIERELNKINNGSDLLIGDEIDVRCFDVDHGPNIREIPEENLGFLINIDGKSVYFAGDMYLESGLNVKYIEADFVMLPIGGFYTFGIDEALDFAKKFQRVGKIIPMHYEKDSGATQRFIDKAKGQFEIEVIDKA